MSDKHVRNLAHLQGSASTARVLNLLGVYKRSGATPEHREAPFFANEVLNRAIILKHRLRRDEAGLFYDGRKTATKIIIPIDAQDLSVGGRSVFVNQTNYDAIMETVFSDAWLANSPDRELLAILDGIPSLDPFLLREHLKRHERHPARCYFEVSEGDMNRMFRYVQGEVQKLIDLCFAGADAGPRSQDHSSRLVQKILSNTVDADTEPLRLTLRLEKRDYQEGVFCWKGFLYYKWTLSEALPDVRRVSDAIAKARPRGSTDTETRIYLEKTRATLSRSILQLCKSAVGTLKFYDAAFESLVEGEPQAFREFLLGAPAMFSELGERLGAVNHIVSFWNYRFPAGKLPVVTPEELVDIFADFESSLSFDDLRAA